MDATRREKLKRFASDTLMKDAVHSVLLMSFLKERKGADVHTLAASRVAIDMMQEAWKEIERYRSEADEKPEPSGNPGV